MSTTATKKLLLSPADYELFSGRNFEEDYSFFATRLCAYCGDDEPGTRDHVIPKSRGGADEPDNLVYCCHPCNFKKGAKTPEEAGMPIIYVEESKVAR